MVGLRRVREEVSIPPEALVNADRQEMEGARLRLEGNPAASFAIRASPRRLRVLVDASRARNARRPCALRVLGERQGGY